MRKGGGDGQAGAAHRANEVGEACSVQQVVEELEVQSPFRWCSEELHFDQH